MRERLANRRYARAAVVAAVLIAVCFYAAFVKQLPFSSHFVMRADFRSSNQLEPGNPVRIGGLQIGTVTGVGPGPGNTSIVTMEIGDHSALHADASLSIEPRLLFEGNFYVAVDPGTPEAPAMRSGETVPLSHTTTPVQLDQLLDVLDAPARYSLKRTFAALATGLGDARSQGAGPVVPAGAGSEAPPGAGSEVLRAAARQLAAALPSVAQVAGAAQGTEPGDLARTIGSASDLTSQLARDPAALADLVTSFDRVVGALAANDRALSQDVEGLDTLVRIAPATLTALDRALPELTRFARGLHPTLAAAPSTLRATNSLFVQLHGLVGAPELPALVTALAPVARALPGLESRLRPLLPRATALGVCLSRNVVPALDTTLQDGANTSGYPAWKDLLHLGAALSGASESFDGNGVALRIGVAEGSQTLAGLLPGIGDVAGSYQGEGIRPEWLGYGVVPPFRPDQQCDRQPPAEINMRSGAAPDALHFVTRSSGGR